MSAIVLELRPHGKTHPQYRCHRTRNKITARRSGAKQKIYVAERGGVIKRSQETFEATLTNCTTVFIENRTPLHLSPTLQALKPNVGDRLEGNEEERTEVYLFMTIRNTAIDQGAAICKKTMTPGKCIHDGQRRLDKHCIAVR